MADARGLDLDENLAVLGTIELNRLDLERLAGLVSDSGASLHDHLPGLSLGIFVAQRVRLV